MLTISLKTSSCKHLQEFASFVEDMFICYLHLFAYHFYTYVPSSILSYEILLHVGCVPQSLEAPDLKKSEKVLLRVCCNQL